MPLGSSSAAPVMSPGPRRLASPCRLSSSVGSSALLPLAVAATVFARRTVDDFAALVAGFAPPAFLIPAPPQPRVAAAGFCLPRGRMEEAMHRLDDDRAFTDARRDAFDRARADIAHG